MEIDIAIDVLSSVKRASKDIGLSEEEIVRRAVIIYLRNLRKQSDLNKEISSWEEAGEYDSNSFFDRYNL